MLVPVIRKPIGSWTAAPTAPVLPGRLQGHDLLRNMDSCASANMTKVLWPQGRRCSLQQFSSSVLGSFLTRLLSLWSCRCFCCFLTRNHVRKGKSGTLWSQWGSRKSWIGEKLQILGLFDLFSAVGPYKCSLHLTQHTDTVGVHSLICTD